MGLVLAIGGAGMVVSGLVGVVTDGRAVQALVGSGLVTGLPGLAVWRLTTVPDRLSTASIFGAVLMSWVGLSLAGTLPFVAAGTFPHYDLALFESVSGFTTTGSTVLATIEVHPRGILFWRSITQWMGGIGVVVFAVSVLPFLGVGGMDLLEAEAPGPSSERLAPRVRETAKRLVTLYGGFSLLVAGAYWLFGMNLYDAVAHMFTTVSTGGFSPYQSSFAHFGSGILEWTAILAMVVAGGNFALYYRAITGRRRDILRSTEGRAYVGWIVMIAGGAALWNVLREGLGHDVVRRTVFTVVSLTSSTGYTDLDYDRWAGALRLVLVFGMALGGMAGSTTGGFKVFRLLTILGYARRQIFRQLHPRAVAVVRLGKDPLPEELVSRVIGFFVLFMAIGALATLLVAATGTDMDTAISAVASSIGNVGPGLGAVGPTQDFLNLHGFARAVLMVVMLVGRLEVFPVLLGFVGLARTIERRLPPEATNAIRRRT